MLLRYTGDGECVPSLGGESVGKGDIREVRNERIARELIKSARWEEAKPKQFKAKQAINLNQTSKPGRQPSSSGKSKGAETS